VPASLTIPQGQTTGTFTVTTSVVGSTQSPTITATSANTATAGLTLNPPSPGPGTIQSLGISPSTVTGGQQNPTGTVTLASPAAAGGVLVTLSSNNASATVPASLVIPQGQTSGTFTVTTSVVGSTQSPTITATSANTATAGLTMNPAQVCPNSLNLNVKVTNVITGQGLLTATVGLDGPSPQGGETINLVSAQSQANSTIFVPGGQTSATAQVPVVNAPTLVGSVAQAVFGSCPGVTATIGLSL
jgi:hypothetical protein